jgi:uncharacterized membrane protein (DUF106 family)
MDIFGWIFMAQAPGATVTIMLISFGISLLNSTINRLLISRLVGWGQYKAMQKETAEYRAETTAALRSKDTKAMEKLKRREKQIMSMQKQMAKPQLVLFLISMSYIFIWLFGLGPWYGASVVAYIPGFGPIGIFYWYFVCSFLFGTLSSRILNILPIE